MNVAAALTLSGHRTLMVDFGPQGHGTLALGRDPGLVDRTMHDVMIDESVSMAEAPNAGEPVLTYAPRSRATFEYKRFTREMVSRIENCGGIL